MNTGKVEVTVVASDDDGESTEAKILVEIRNINDLPSRWKGFPAGSSFFAATLTEETKGYVTKVTAVKRHRCGRRSSDGATCQMAPHLKA